MAHYRITTRRGLCRTLLGLSTATFLHGALDSGAWRAYESAEQAWIRDRHQLLIKLSPVAAGAAQIDLELKLAELQRRAFQFRHLSRRHPRELRGGVWQLSWLPFTDRAKSELEAADPAYRRQEQRIRGLGTALRSHPQYEMFRQSQIDLWKTPQYRDLHKKYSERMLI